MKVKTWRIVDRGEIPVDAKTVPFQCRCGYEAELPVLGRVLAITGGHTIPTDEGIFFDTGHHAVPPVIQCRKCRRILTTEASPDVR